MKLKENGFTLIELIVVIAIMGILMAVSAPSMLDWMQSARYRGVAQELNSALRDARSRSIASNLEYSIEFFVDGGKQKYRIREGNRASNSSVWINVAPPKIWEVPKSVKLVTAVTSLAFNPNGSSGAGSVYICGVSGPCDENNNKFSVVLVSSGRVRIKKL